MHNYTLTVSVTDYGFVFNIIFPDGTSTRGVLNTLDEVNKTFEKELNAFHKRHVFKVNTVPRITKDDERNTVPYHMVPNDMETE